MEDIFEHLRRQGVDQRIVDKVREFRASHGVAVGLEDRVPAPETAYIGKRVWETACAVLLAGENLLLAGPKATGKNVLAENLACAFGRPLWNVSLHIDTDAATLVGEDTYADGRVSFREGPIVRCARAGGFCVLDEVNMARSEALSVLHATLDHRRIVDVPGYDLVRLDGACRFIATMNVGYAGTRELNEALASRFAIVRMPALGEEDLEALLQACFPDLEGKAVRQFALLFTEIRLKCENGELTDRALDLRGMMDAIRLMREGLDARAAVEACVVNKVFDGYERQILQDVVDARLPKATKRGLFA